MKKAVVMLSAVLALVSTPVLGAARADQTAAQIAAIRAATAKYQDIEKAKADGYIQGSLMVPNMGYHFRNPAITGMDLDKPHLLLYVKTTDGSWQLVGVEYAYPKGTRPPAAQVPFRKPQWAVHGAACHFKDANEIPMKDKEKCPAKHPETGAELARWHPDLETLHIWAWYPNPRGVFVARNPWLAPFNPPAPPPQHQHQR